MAEYIERGTLRKILENWRDAHADADDEQGCGLLEDVIWEVDAQPAADVVPVQHARWSRPYLKWPWTLFKIKNPYCFCTNCICAVKAKKITKYCPECGAQMDGAE